MCDTANKFKKTAAVIEDDDTEFISIKTMLDRFTSETADAPRFECVRFDNAVTFLQNYKPVYDIVFMDIGLPGMNGFEAAKKLRETDGSVLLIFVTNMSQFAVSGYEVGAFDFIVKPIKYGAIKLKLTRALQKLDSRDDKKITVPSTDGMRVVSVSTIRYVEVMNHDIVYHTTQGDIKSYGSLKKAEAVLPADTFTRCNSCYLVNLKYVTGIKEFTAFVGGDEISISHSKKKDFLDAIAKYMEAMA